VVALEAHMLSLTHVDYCFGLLAFLFYFILALAKTEDFFPRKRRTALSFEGNGLSH